MDMSGDPLLARVLAARRRITPVRVADLGLCQRDPGVLEEDVCEGDNSRGGVDEEDEQRDEEEEQEARAGLHCGWWWRVRGEVVIVRRSVMARP